MSMRRLATIAVVVLTSLAVLPLVFVFVSKNLGWLHGFGGTMTFFVTALGLFAGLIGGVVLAIALKNPLWLIATVSALCVGYVWVVLAANMAIASTH